MNSGVRLEVSKQRDYSEVTTNLDFLAHVEMNVCKLIQRTLIHNFNK